MNIERLNQERASKNLRSCRSDCLSSSSYEADLKSEKRKLEEVMQDLKVSILSGCFSVSLNFALGCERKVDECLGDRIGAGISWRREENQREWDG